MTGFVVEYEQVVKSQLVREVLSSCEGIRGGGISACSLEGEAASISKYVHLEAEVKNEVSSKFRTRSRFRIGVNRRRARRVIETWLCNEFEEPEQKL